MAYLLTEIALEMLGCRFYDIYGQPQDIKYIAQDDMPANGPTGNLKNEPHLDSLLSFSGSNTNASTSASTGGTAALSSNVTAASTSSSSVPTQGDWSSSATSSASTLSNVPRQTAPSSCFTGASTSSSVLRQGTQHHTTDYIANADRPSTSSTAAISITITSDQIEQEMQKVKQQLLQQRCLAMTDCKLKANATEKDLHIVTETLIRNEYKKLTMEAHSLFEIRRMLESGFVRRKP